MAETIARRLIKQDEWADSFLEPPAAAVFRAKARQRARVVWRSHLDCKALAASLGLPTLQVEALMRSPWFGSFWSELETASSQLRRHRVPMAALRDAIVQAKPILERLRQYSPHSEQAATTISEQDLRLVW